MYTPFFLLTADESYQGLRHHIRLLEASAERWRLRDERRLTRRPSRDPERQEFREFMHDELHGEILPRLSRYSCLLALCAVNEANLATLCRVADKRLRPTTPLPPKLLREFPGTPLRYLRKVFMPPPARHPFESRLADLQHVRNCIAHCGGEADRYRNSKAAREAAKRLGWRVHGGYGQIDIPSGALGPLVNASRQWFEALYAPLHGQLRDAGPKKPPAN